MHIELRGLTKQFGSQVACDRIDLTIEPGTIHCLLGENGAGKTTLMNMVYGLLQPDAGEILLDGQPHTCHTPRDAIDAGIGMVHQHFMLVPVFTVAENIMLGREPTSLPGVLDYRKARSLLAELSARYGFTVDPDRLVEDLPVGIQQWIEIMKALLGGADVLILDEPTAVLTPQETDELIGVLRALRDDGTAVVFISHKLKEVKAIADTITVLRQGRVVGTAGPDRSEAELAELMVGREVTLQVDKTRATGGEPVLEVEGLTIIDERGARAVDDLSLDVRAGEILAIAGVQGNGQSELVRALVGLEESATGSIRVDGVDLAGAPPERHLRAGIGYIPEDRSHDGFVGAFSVAENLVLDLYRTQEFSEHGVLSPAAVAANAEHRVQEFDIRTGSSRTPVATLSGGNQQKVVLARELSRPLRVLVAGQPTRGLDVGSIEFMHRRIVAERDRGTAVLLVSTELDEVAALADRVAVMYAGRIVGVVPPDTPRDQLGLMMAGGQPQAGGTDAD